MSTPELLTLVYGAFMLVCFFSFLSTEDSEVQKKIVDEVGWFSLLATLFISIVAVIEHLLVS